MENPIQHAIDKAEKLYDKLDDELKELVKEAKADGMISKSEDVGIQRANRKLSELEAKIKDLKDKKAKGIGVPNPKDGEYLDFDDDKFFKSFHYSVTTWIGQMRDAINILSDLAGSKSEKPKVELGDVLSLMGEVKGVKEVKAAYDMLMTMKKVYEAALQTYASKGKLTLVQVRLAAEQAVDSVEKELEKPQAYFNQFIADYQKQNGIDSVEKANTALFDPECFYFGTNYLPTKSSVEKSFAKAAVGTLFDKDWGEAVEMEPEDGEKAGYVIIRCVGKAKYVGVPKEHDEVSWGTPALSVDEASDGMMTALGRAYKDTGLLDLPMRMSAVLTVKYTNGMGAYRKAQFFRGSDTPGSTDFNVREDIVVNTVGAPNREKKGSESMELFRAFQAAGVLKKVTGKDLVK